MDYISFIKDHQGLRDRVNAHEHITFLTYWLSEYIFYARSVQVANKYVCLVTQFHEWRNICLIRLIICGMYESLELASQDLREMVNPYSLLIGGPIRLLQLWLSATFKASLKTRVYPSSGVEV